MSFHVCAVCPRRSRQQEAVMPRAKSKQKQKPPAWWIERQRAVARMRDAQATRERDGLRKRYQSDLLQFWRRCADARCRRKRTCKGEPDGCLGRGLAAMSGPDREWLRGAIMATVKGARSLEELVRGTGEEIAAARCAKPMDVQGLAACLTQLLAEPAGASALPQGDEQADGEACVVVSKRKRPASPGTEADMVEWSPVIGSSVDPVRAAALPPPADAPLAFAKPKRLRFGGARSARAGPASPGPADAVPAGPPQPGPPPAIEPWQAWCDDEGRLHMPDPAAVRERFRMLTRDEIQQRMRAYGA
jgi:hypothetical protein